MLSALILCVHGQVRACNGLRARRVCLHVCGRMPTSVWNPMPREVWAVKMKNPFPLINNRCSFSLQGSKAVVPEDTAITPSGRPSRSQSADTSIN